MQRVISISLFHDNAQLMQEMQMISRLATQLLATLSR